MLKKCDSAYKLLPHRQPHRAIYWGSSIHFLHVCLSNYALLKTRTYTAGPGVQGLDPQNVHVCADIELAWPIENWSRNCVSLQDLVRLYFGRAMIACQCFVRTRYITISAMFYARCTIVRAFVSPLKTAMGPLGSQVRSDGGLLV